MKLFFCVDKYGPISIFLFRLLKKKLNAASKQYL